MEERLTQIISMLHSALASVRVAEKGDMCRALAACLNDAGEWNWVPSLPVAYIHNAERIKSVSLQKRLTGEGWTDQDGRVREGLTRSEIMRMADTDIEAVVQEASLAPCLKDALMDRLPFAPKRAGDYWKRLDSADFLAAVIDMDIRTAGEVSPQWIAQALEQSDAGQWQAETALRDAVRSKKENTPLRGKPFIWVTVISGAGEKDAGEVVNMLGHYFGENLLQGAMQGGCFVIGYSEELNGVSLRTFYKKR